jgi:hypothetical protein
MRNISGKSCGENPNTLYAQYVFPGNRSVFDITWEREAAGDNKVGT